MILRGTEDKRLFFLVDLFHEQLHAMSFAFFDLDDLVEVVFLEVIADFDLTLNQLVIGGVGVFVQRRCDLLYTEGCEKARY